MDIIKSVFMCLCRNDIRERSDNTKKCQWFEDASLGAQLEPSVAMGTVCGSPWFPLSPQLMLGEDYVTPGLKEQMGRLL